MFESLHEHQNDAASLRSGSVHEESVGDKLAREWQVVGKSALSGAKKCWDEARAHPGSTLAKLGGAMLVGGGLAFLQGRTGVLRLGAQVFGLSLGYSFLNDIGTRSGQVFGAIGDTWRSGANAEQNSRLVEHTVGPFVFDTALTTLGGVAGVGAVRGGYAFARAFRGSRFEVPVLKLADTPGIREVFGSSGRMAAVPLSRTLGESVELGRQGVHVPGLEMGSAANARHSLFLPKDAPLARLYQQSSQSVGRVEVLARGGDKLRGEFGSAFSVSADGKLATALHVVDDALAISVFDAQGRPHSAKVASIDPRKDLAILQLDKSSSYGAFKPMSLSEAPAAVAEEGFAVAFGHPNGWNRMFASPGRVVRQDANSARFLLHGEHGNSGGPIVNESGRVIAVLTSGDWNSANGVNGIPSRFVTQLLDKTPARIDVTSTRWTNAGSGDGAMKSAPHLVPERARELVQYAIPNREAATMNLSDIFGPNFAENRAPDFFHSRVKRVDFVDEQGRGRQLILKTEFNPADRAIVVRPIGMNGNAIPADSRWPASLSRILDAELTVKLNESNQPVSMSSKSDALLLLPQAFNYPGRNNYLSQLQPTGGTRMH